jgi:plasmid stabilization system protein ParE
VSRVEVSAAAREDLERLIFTHSLPPDTTARVRASLRHLERFPLLGAELPGRWSGYRFLLGPWRWMLLVYIYVADEDRVVLVTVQDGRSAHSPTSA